MKLVIYLTGASLTGNGPFVDHPGASGAAYEYRWSPRHQLHILEGREFDSASDLKRIAHDVFTAEHGFRHPMPLLVEAEASPGDDHPATITAASIIADVESHFPAPEDRVKFGMRLVNAYRRKRPRRTP